MNKTVTTLASLVALALPMTAMADGILYANDFEAENSLGSEWSRWARLDGNENFSQFNGRYARNDDITLTLYNLPDRGGVDNGSGDDDGGGGGNTDTYIVYTITFDLYIIDTWDGDGTPGPDVLELRQNGNILLHDTFTNLDWETQSFRAPDVGPTQLGYDMKWNDSIYRRVSRDFTLDDQFPKLTLTWQSFGLQGVNDESWGIDNVEVSYRTVPAPASIVPLLGLGCLGRRRRS